MRIESALGSIPAYADALADRLVRDDNVLCFMYNTSATINTYPMQISKKQINDTQVELEVSATREDIQPVLEHTAAHISQHKNIPGFRPGKAPYEIVKRHVGEDVIFREALDDIVNSTLTRAIMQEKLKVMEESDFKLKQMTPENVSYTINITLLPEVSLGSWTEKKIKKQAIEVSDEEAEKSLKDLAKMLVREEKVEREAKDGDSIVVDFEVSVDGKPIENGSGKQYTIVIGDKKMIPGFEENLIGHKASDEFTFPIQFPKDYAEHLAGKDAEVKIKVHEVLVRTVPEIDDELAKRLGEKDRASLVERLKENLRMDKQQKEEQRLEIEAVKAVVDNAKIGPIPENAVNQELDGIMAEFEHDLGRQGMQMDAYLKTINKSLEDLKKEFKPKAEERVRTALVLNQVIDENNIDVTDKEIDHELSHQKEHFRNNPQALEDISHPSYRKHLRNRIFNRKAVKFIVEKLVE
jgi:trigger factor